MKTYFIITTNGQAASKWLAQSLNLNEKICASHGTLRIPECFTYHREYNDIEIAHAFEDESRRESPLSYLFGELVAWDSSYDVYGNVHMFNLRHLHSNLESNFYDMKHCVVMDLVRHPVNLIRSSAANMLQQSTSNSRRVQYLKNVKELNKKLYNDYRLKYSLNLDDLENLSFMAAVMTLYSLDINLRLSIPNGRRVLMEKLTTDKEYYLEFVKEISRGKADLSDEYIKKVFSQDKANAHVLSNKINSPAEIFNSWNVWQKELFTNVLSKTKVKESYEQLGYIFDFLK